MKLYPASYWIARALQVGIGAYVALLIWTALT